MMHRRVTALALSFLLLLSLAACGGDPENPTGASASQPSDSPGTAANTANGTQGTAAVNPTDSQNTDPSGTAASNGTNAAGTTGGISAGPSGTAPAQGTAPSQKVPSAAPPSTAPPSTVPAPSVTLVVDCSTAVENGIRAQPGFDQIIPADGIILRDESCPLEPGKDSALGLLQRALGEKNIPLKVRGGYISSINGLKERILPDAYGKKSKGGWIYLVNGSMPGVSSSAYKPQAGDTILFAYTCEEGDVIMKQLD